MPVRGHHWQVGNPPIRLPRITVDFSAREYSVFYYREQCSCFVAQKLGPRVIVFYRTIFESVVPDVGAKVEFVQGIGSDYRAGLNLRMGV